MLFELTAHHLPAGWIRRTYVGGGSLWFYYNTWTHIPEAGPGHSLMFAATQKQRRTRWTPTNTISDKGANMRRIATKNAVVYYFDGVIYITSSRLCPKIFTSDRFVEPDGPLRSLLAPSTQYLACFIHTNHHESESRRLEHSVLIFMYGRRCGRGLVKSSNVRFCHRA